MMDWWQGPRFHTHISFLRRPMLTSKTCSIMARLVRGDHGQVKYWRDRARAARKAEL